MIRSDKSVVLKLAQPDPLNVELITPAASFGSIKAGMKSTVGLTPFTNPTNRRALSWAIN